MGFILGWVVRMPVTRQMIGAGHDVTIKRGLVLHHELLEAIYEAMHAKRSRVTWACPVCAASVETQEVCDCEVADMPFCKCCKVGK